MLLDLAQVEPILVILADDIGVDVGDFARSHDERKDALVVELQGGVVAVGDEVGVVAVRHQTPLGGLQDDRGDGLLGAVPEFGVLVAGGDDAAHEAAGIVGVGQGLGDLLLKASRADELDGVLGGECGCVAHGRIRR